MRALRIAGITAAILALFVIVYLLKFLGSQHKFINTQGMLAYACDQNTPGFQHIWLANSDGSNAHPITSGNYNDTSPSFSPDGSQIAFLSDRSGSTQVYIMEADGKAAHAITIGSDSKILPKFSADGTHIAFISGGRLSVADLVANSTDLILPSSDTSEAQGNQEQAQVVRAPVLDYEWQPSTDPSKTQIAAIQQDPSSDIQAVSLIPEEGGKPIVVFEAQTVSAAWSPDGATLAAAGLGIATPSQAPLSAIALFQASGTPTGLPPVAPAPSDKYGPQQPSFTPDGTKIVFTVMAEDAQGITSSKGAAIVALDNPNQPKQIVQAPVQNPQFSPDGLAGMFLAPSTKDRTKTDIYIAGTTAGKVITIVNGQGNVTSAVWSPSKGKP